MNDFFTTNILALNAHTPASACLSPSLPTTVTVQATPSGNATVKINNILIHSSYDPIKEGEKFARSIQPGSMVCLYGYGLGYHLPPLLKQIGPDGFLLVIELNKDLLTAAMLLRDQTPILNHHRFHLIFGEDEGDVAAEILKYTNRLKSFLPSHQQILFHSPSFKCFPPQFPRIANALEVLLMERRFPAVLGGLEDDNYALNKDIVAQTPGINTLKNAYQGRPAVLASAGPSLDDALPFLHRLSGKILLTCVDTSLPILTRERINPDYVFSLDPQDESLKHFMGTIDPSVKLVFTPTACAEVVSRFPGEKLVVFKEGSAQEQNNSNLAQEKGRTQAGGSVSCLGLDSLIQFGCNPIILVGQDCAFTGMRNYSKHSNINEQLIDKLGHRQTLTGSHLENTRQQKQVAVECADGSHVYTSQLMYSYLRTLEQIAGAHPQTRVYNLCSHGALIENIHTLGSVSELTNILET